jgi:hypothetical protein
MLSRADVSRVLPVNYELPPVPKGATGCPSELLVGSKDNTKRALRIVEKWCPISTNQSMRVPPLVYQSMARGGKTTFLMELFQELKSSNAFAPIYITLNGGFKPYIPETPTQSIIRLIGLQLAGLDGAVKGVVVDTDEVMSVLAQSTKPVVLLVDELNYFGNPVEMELATFLKTEFLDKAGRYLVVSTHVPMGGELDNSSGNILSGTSGRNFEIALSPICLDIGHVNDVLRKCNLLVEPMTKATIAFFSGMMPLIFSQYAGQNVVSMVRERVVGSDFRIKNEKKEIAGFLDAVFTGNVGTARPEFARFGTNQIVQITNHAAEVSEARTNAFRWPVVYIFEILRLYTVARDTNIMVLMEDFAHSFSPRGTGAWFKNLITFAVLLRCLQVSVDPLALGPFRVVADYRDRGSRDFIRTEFMIFEATTVADADSELLSRLSESRGLKLIVAKPNCAGFPSVDLLLYFRHYEDGKEVIQKLCFQIKEGNEYPKAPVPVQFSAGYAITGLPAAKPRGPQSAPAGKNVPWKCVNEKSVTDLLGCSMEHMLPKNWTGPTAQS